LWSAPAGYPRTMPKDRDQLTPADPEDAEHLATHRGQGAAGSGRDLLPEEAADEAVDPAAAGPDGA
jgi:hypothetical protein